MHIWQNTSSGDIFRIRNIGLTFFFVPAVFDVASIAIVVAIAIAIVFAVVVAVGPVVVTVVVVLGFCLVVVLVVVVGFARIVYCESYRRAPPESDLLAYSCKNTA